jgi:Ca2+-binding RTX toxin-like protein
LAGDTLWLDGADPARYLAAEQLQLTGGAGNDTVDVTGMTPGTQPTVDGGGGSDTLTGSNAVNNFILLGPNQGLHNWGPFFSFENLRGGDADHNVDQFIFTNGAGAGVSGRIDGGGGTNTLSYTQLITDLYYGGYEGNALVNLRLGTATGVAGGIANIHHVIGGVGHDILVGGAGANRLEGRGGHDILIGGLGADVLEGGDGSDILIGGRTARDGNNAGLRALRTAWAQDLGYTLRVANLRPSLHDGTVFDDGSADALTGGGGLDWFWAEGIDEHDRDPLTEVLD